MPNPETSQQVYEGEQSNVERLRGNVEEWGKRNEILKQIIEMAK